MEKKQQGEMSFLDHVEVLRWHIVRSLISIILLAIVVFLFKDFVFDTVILGPKKASFVTYQFICQMSESMCFYPPEFKLIPKELGEQFFVHIKVSIWLGVILGFPYIIYEVWKFIKPGLYKNEQKAARGLVFICSMLFLMGVLFGYFVMSPFAVTFLSGYSLSDEIVSSPTLSSYVNYMTMFTLPTGLIFELPIAVYFLSKIGLVTPEFMKKYRRHAIILILLMSAMITPPDIITQFIIGIPIFILYEISISISKRVTSKNEEE